jgi:hypothetical protein
MNQTEKLLQNIVENARMGEDACDQLLCKAEDESIRQELMQQKQQYAAASQAAEQKLTSMGVYPQPKGPMARMGMWMGMEMDTMMDKSPSHIADMLIQGATMGIVEMTKARNSNPDASGQAKQIAADFITGQQEAVDRLKSFLLQKA